MPSPLKNPHGFTDSILVREIRRRVDPNDDRLEWLLDEVDMRLHDLKAARIRRLEVEVEELRDLALTLVAEVPDEAVARLPGGPPYWMMSNRVRGTSPRPRPGWHVNAELVHGGEDIA